MTTIEKLEEVEKIKQLKARYCRFIDTKQWDAFAELLAEDVHLTFKDPAGAVLVQFDNRQDMLNLTIPMLETAITVHQVHQPEIKIISLTEATAIWALEDWIIFPENTKDAPYQSMHGFGIYHERLTRKENTWQISSFVLERLKLDITH